MLYGSISYLRPRASRKARDLPYQATSLPPLKVWTAKAIQFIARKGSRGTFAATVNDEQ
jgi:hypothetical protein